MRMHRVEVWSPAGRWVWGQWVELAGTGTYVDRLERAARDTLASEPAGSLARAYRYAAHSLDPMTLVLTVTVPAPPFMRTGTDAGGVKIQPTPAALDPSQASQ